MKIGPANTSKSTGINYRIWSIPPPANRLSRRLSTSTVDGRGDVGERGSISGSRNKRFIKNDGVDAMIDEVISNL